MKRLMLTLVAALPLLLPAAHAFGFQDALQAAQSRPDAVTKRLELLNDNNELVRVQSDPLALKMDLVKAQQKVALDRAQLEKAYDDALVTIAQAYTGVLEAREQVAIAAKGVDVAQASLDIAKIRRSNGSGTDLDVQDAQVSLDNANKNAQTAQKSLAIAVANLESLVGQKLDASNLDPIPDAFLVAVPSSDEAIAALPRTPQLLQSEQGLVLARLGVEMLDPSYASASQIESAKTQLQTTEKLVTEAKRGLEIQAKNLVVQAQSAADSYRIEQDNLTNADQRLRFASDRLASGLIPKIQYQKAELDQLQAKLSALQARDGYVVALLQLQSGTQVKLEGPSVYDFAATVGPLPGEAGGGTDASPSGSGGGTKGGAGNGTGNGQ
ncbi:MAG: TolC family protein [Deinococcales bacterium]